MSSLVRTILRRLPKAQTDVHFFRDNGRGEVAITIDDAPDPVSTQLITNVLDGFDVKASFFITGNHALESPKELERLVENSHDLCNHQMMNTQPAIRQTLSDFETHLLGCHQILQEHVKPRFFRPSHGFYSDEMIEIVKKHGYITVLGEAFPIDTHLPFQPIRLALLKALIQPGSIIILHDRENRGRRTAETLRRLLPWLRDKGLQPVTLTKLFSDDMRSTDATANDFLDSQSLNND